MIDALVEALKAYGVPGLLIALAVLVSVFLARESGLVVSGNMARLANVALSAVLSGLSGAPEADRAVLAALSSLMAALAYEALKYLAGRIKPAPAG